MKSFVPAVLALVIGIVLGSWQPRGELLQTRQEMDELRARSKGDCRGERAMDGIRDILRAKPPDALNAPDDPPEADTATAANPAAPGEPPPPSGPVDMAKEVGVMQAALDARRSQALAALIEQGDLSDEQVEAVERAMDEMNNQLRAQVDEFVAAANAGDEPDRRDMMEFAADTLDIVLVADDQMRAIVPAEAYDSVDPETVDPFSYLSGEAVASLAKLEALPEFE